MRTKKAPTTTTTSSAATLLPSASLDLIEKAFENGCLDGQLDRRLRRINALRPTPNIDGIRFNARQREAVKAYKLGYMMAAEVFSF